MTQGISGTARSFICSVHEALYSPNTLHLLRYTIRPAQPKELEILIPDSGEIGYVSLFGFPLWSDVMYLSILFGR